MPERVILGIDEVGRGPWAGPLLVGAVVFSKKFRNFSKWQQKIADSESDLSKLARSETERSLYLAWTEFDDSKQLTPKKRETLAKIIHENAAATGFGWVSSAEIDRLGLSEALKLATRRAVKQVLKTETIFTEIVIDGTTNFLSETPLADRVTLLPKADALVKEVSAASIIAKVARDQYMVDLAEKYPGYGFERHAGYGTAAHRAAINRLGVCPEHRKSFRPIQKLLHSAPKLETPARKSCASAASALSKARGELAENLVRDYLKSQNHAIIAHNFRTRLYEIDLISTKDQTIYFTEVKSRLDDSQGSPLEQITDRKHTQIRRAANDFLANHPEFANFNPVLAVASVSGTPAKLEEWFILSD